MNHFITESLAELLNQVLCISLLMIERQAHAEPELRVVFKQRIAPRRSAAFAIYRVGRRWQVAAVNTGTASRIRNDRAIAEELRRQLDVRSLAAAGASTREFK